MKDRKKNDKVNTIQDYVLANLGLDSIAEIGEWIQKGRMGTFEVQNMKEAVQLVSRFKEKTVVICGDYDADGVNGTAILKLALEEAGFQHVIFLIPDKLSEGFGLNSRMVSCIVDEYTPEDTCLLLVDNGIAAVKPIREAKEAGLTVVVLDHHQAHMENGSMVLPDADILIDPSALAGTADFSGYCGAGLAYKFAQQLLGVQAAYKYIPNAAIATVADVMKLQGENYFIVRTGLQMMNDQQFLETIPTGLRMLLLSLFGADTMGHIDETSIAFQIAPTLNAPGRMQEFGANQAVDLLIERQAPVAMLKAQNLVNINAKRKQLQSAAEELLPELMEEKQEIYVLYVPDTNPGIVGILAGHVTEKTGHASIVLTDSKGDPEELTGSARSIEGLNIKEALDQTANLLSHYGGHEGAAGLGLRRKNLDSFRKDINAYVESLHLEYTQDDEVVYDLQVNVAEVPGLIAEMTKFAPFGEGNPKPVVKVTDFLVRPVYGSYKKVIKNNGIKLMSVTPVQAIGFRMGEKMEPYQNPTRLNLYGTLSNNFFRGNITPQVEFTNFEVLELDDEEDPELHVSL